MQTGPLTFGKSADQGDVAVSADGLKTANLDKLSTFIDSAKSGQKDSVVISVFQGEVADIQKVTSGSDGITYKEKDSNGKDKAEETCTGIKVDQYSVYADIILTGCNGKKQEINMVTVPSKELDMKESASR